MYAQNQYSSFTHLARAVLGARYHREDSLFAMMTCYFDESFETWVDEHGDSRKFTFVCGYVASVEQWEQFEIEWRAYLDRYEIQDFHLTDYCSSSNEYKKWKGSKFSVVRQKFMQDASKIVRKFALRGVISMVPDSVFQFLNESYMLADTFSSPYGLVGRECADLARSQRIKFYPNDSEIRYVFEDGGPDKGGLMRSMTDITPAFPSPIFEPGKNQKPSTKHPDGRKAILQLQSADYLAYEVRKFFTDQIKMPAVRGVRLSFKALTQIPTEKTLFTVENLEAKCEILKIPKR